jgi:hypothetical protein
MYVLCNREVCWRNHCCSRKAVSFTNSECVFVVLVIQHAKLQLYYHLCPVHLYSTFTCDLINSTICGGKSYRTHNIFLFSLLFVCNISHYKKKWTRYCYECLYGFMLSTCYSCQILIKGEFCRQIFDQCSNTKFHANPSWGSRVPWGQKDRHDEVNSPFRNFVNAPKNWLTVDGTELMGRDRLKIETNSVVWSQVTSHMTTAAAGGVNKQFRIKRNGEPVSLYPSASPGKGRKENMKVKVLSVAELGFSSVSSLRILFACCIECQSVHGLRRLD